MTACILALLLPASALQEDSLEAKRDEKLKKPFLTKSAWITDYEQALAESKKQKKPIFAFFTRSYAPCPPCLALEGGALLTDAFTAFSKDYVLFCHVTTQIPTDKHQDLLEKKGGQGFPHLVFMDEEGAVLATHDGDRKPEAFSTTGQKAKAFIDVREKAAKGDPAAKIDFLIAQLELGQAGDEEAGKRAKELPGATPEQAKKIEALRVGAAVREILSKIQDHEGEDAAGRKFLAMKKTGRPEPPGDGEVQPYWLLMMHAAEKDKDPATYEDGLKALKARFGTLEEAKEFFKNAEQTLRTLKGAK